MVVEVLVILALVLLSAIFAGAEIAVLAMRRARLRDLIKAGRGAAVAVDALREHPERFLATVQVAVTVIGAAAGAFGGATLARDLTPALARLGLGGAAGAVAFAVVVVVVAYLSLVLGELVPRSLALRHAERYSLVIGRPFTLLAALLRPVVWFLTASSNLILRVFGDRTTFSEARLSSEELQQLVEEAGQTGSLDPRIAEIASRSFDFSELPVSAVMVPRGQIVGVPRRARGEEVRRILLEEGHSRMPVYEDSLDHVAGYVVAMDVLALSLEHQLFVLDDILRPAHFIPETTRAVEALKGMQRRRTQLALVVDESGSVSGLVTIEDLVEELVGEIFDEKEKERPRALVTREPSGAAVVAGTAPIREVNRELGLDLPQGEGYSTIAGLCIQLAGVIPSPGTKLQTADGVGLEVVEASARRVRKVRIRPAG
jgi:putative hemolysin